MTPHGDTDLGQHGLRLWLVVWRHQAITGTNDDLSPVLVLCHSPKGNNNGYSRESNPYNTFKIYTFKIKAISPGDDGLMFIES